MVLHCITKTFIILFGTSKAPGALDPTIVLPPLRVKIYYGHSRNKSQSYSGSLQRIFVWPSKNRRSGTSDHEKNWKEKKGYYQTPSWQRGNNAHVDNKLSQGFSLLRWENHDKNDIKFTLITSLTKAEFNN